MSNPLFIVTGACGHLGNTIVRALVEEGHCVIGIDLPGARCAALAGVRHVRCAADITDYTQLESALGAALAQAGAADVIAIHTAGIVSIASRGSDLLHTVNVEGTANMVRFCREFGVRRLVYVSSVHALRERPHGETISETAEFDPGAVTGAYAKTKAAATAIVLEAAREGLDALVVHPSGIAGPGDYGRGHFTQLVSDYLKRRLTAYVRGGYDFVDVRDVADGIIAAALRGKAGECYILSNRYLSTGEIFGLLARLSGRRPLRTVLPLWFARATVPLAELYYRILRQPPLFTRYSLYTLASNSRFSHAKASSELGYRPRPFEQTLADTIHWLRAQGRVKTRK